MTALIYGIVYAGALVFLVASAARAVRYARLPAHLRWELYPVPHEEPEKARHGGSYFEDKDWWTRRRHYNLAGELKVMVPEMLFLKALWEFNRGLWRRSFLFHFGLYLLGGTGALLGIASLGRLLAPDVMTGTLLGGFHAVYTATGACGAVMAMAGAAGLLHRRLTHPDLKNYTTPGDLFNLAFFLVTFGLLAAGYLLRGAHAPGAMAIARGLVTFDRGLEIPGVLAAGLVLAALLTGYIPLTHMSHFIAKYFTYHNIRWDDLPSAESAEIQRKFAAYLTFRPTWAAPHVGADGVKNWVDIATANPFAPQGKGAKQ